MQIPILTLDHNSTPSAADVASAAAVVRKELSAPQALVTNFDGRSLCQKLIGFNDNSKCWAAFSRKMKMPVWVKCVRCEPWGVCMFVYAYLCACVCVSVCAVLGLAASKITKHIRRGRQFTLQQSEADNEVWDAARLQLELGTCRAGIRDTTLCLLSNILLYFYDNIKVI